MMRFLLPISVAIAVAAATSALPHAAPQDASRTEVLAKELTQLLQTQKLDAIAARLGDDEFAAALFFPDVQMLVVSAKYTAPALLNEKIISRNYRDAYLDLASASVPDSKVFIEDMRGNGLQSRRDGDLPFDIVTRGTGASFAFDGEWKKKKVTEDEYLKTYAGAEASYERILNALIAQARK